MQKLVWQSALQTREAKKRSQPGYKFSWQGFKEFFEIQWHVPFFWLKKTVDYIVDSAKHPCLRPTSYPKKDYKRRYKQKQIKE